MYPLTLVASLLLAAAQVRRMVSRGDDAGALSVALVWLLAIAMMANLVFGWDWASPLLPLERLFGGFSIWLRGGGR